MIRHSGSIPDIATAICSRSNCAIGFVNQHRVVSSMADLCWAANSSKAGMVVGACTAARFHTAEENPGCPWGATRSLIALGATIDAQPSSTIYVVSCLALANAFLLSSMIHCHEFWLLAFLMLSSRLITCVGHPVSWCLSDRVSSIFIQQIDQRFSTS